MITYTTEYVENYLCVFFSGTVNNDSITETVASIHQVVSERNVDVLLVDFRSVEGKFGAFDRISAAKQLSARLKGMTIKIALVAQRERLNYLAEIVGAKHGLNVKAFYSMQKAVEWIRHVPKKQ